MFAGAKAIAARDQLVDLLTHGPNRMIEPLLLGRRILRHQLLHDDSRLMQKHMAEADAFG